MEAFFPGSTSLLPFLTSRTSFLEVLTVYAMAQSAKSRWLDDMGTLGIKILSAIYAIFSLSTLLFSSPISWLLSLLWSSNRPVTIANLIIAKIMLVAGDYLVSGPSFFLFDNPPNAYKSPQQ